MSETSKFTPENPEPSPEDSIREQYHERLSAAARAEERYQQLVQEGAPAYWIDSARDIRQLMRYEARRFETENAPILFPPENQQKGPEEP